MTKMELPETPDVWFFQCQYCESQRQWGHDHETEILTLSRKICKDPHFVDFVRSTLDTWDHAKATPMHQIARVTKIHDDMGCTCQDQLSKIIDASMKGLPTDRLVSDMITSRSLNKDACDVAVSHSGAPSADELHPISYVPSQHQTPGHITESGQKGHPVTNRVISPMDLGRHLSKIHNK